MVYYVCVCAGEEAGAWNLVFFRVKWLQPAVKGSSCARRVQLRSSFLPHWNWLQVADRIGMPSWLVSCFFAMCIDTSGFATWCCKTHCNGCRKVACDLCWGGSRSTTCSYLAVFLYFFWGLRYFLYFPTCQVRVVRFYQSACPPHPPPPPPPRLAVLLLLVLLIASSSSFSSTMSASTSASASALPTRRQALRQLPSSVRTAGPQPGSSPAQCAPLDLNLGRSQLSAHRWTSTWDLSSSVRTAGPQPGTFPAQCAPLDLTLGPSQLSAHRWTSTWDLPSTAR